MKILMKGDSMSFSKKTFVVAGLVAAVALAGCSSDDPDKGSGVSKTEVSGTAVDGYIAGASVYIDTNNNGRKNAGEPSAITDKDGYFTTSIDGVEYCSSEATALQKTHCLKTSEIGSGFVIRTFGGFDVYTGEPFLGSLARRVTPDVNGEVANQMISPLTSMLVDIPEEMDQQSLLDFFDLASADLDADFLDNAEYDANTVNSAIKLHKIVTLFSEVFVERYDAFGEERSFPETPNAIIYKALATRLAAEGADLDEATLTNAFDDAQAAIRALYDDDEDLSAPIAVIVTTVIDDALALIGLVDNAIPAETTFAEAKARVISVEAVLKKMIDGDGDVEEAIDEVSSLYDAIELVLAEDGGEVDFTRLTEINYNAPDFSNIEIEGADSFADLANKQLYIDLNEDGKTGSGFIFFDSDTDATAGNLKLCLEYDDGDQSSTEFEETDGVLLSGTWMALDDSKLILSLAGGLSISLADKGLNGNMQHRYSLSYGGDTRTWSSDNGLLDETVSQNIVESPIDDATCETLLTTQKNQLF